MADLDVIVPGDLLESFDGSATRTLYGVRRDPEGIVQVLAREPRPGLVPVGTLHDGRVWIGSRPVPVQHTGRLDELGSRNGELDLRSRHVVCVGVGSVGSTVAILLAQAGVGRFTLVDPDRVEPANLSRTSYLFTDIGRRKVDGLAERLTGIDPAVDITALPDRFHTLPNCDLVIASTDDATVQLQVNRAAVEAEVPALYIGCHAQAVSGEVLWVVPGTACYACTFGRVRVRPARARTRPYRVGPQTRGVVGLAADIARTVATAAAYALALLGDPARGDLLTDPDRNLLLLQAGREVTRRSRLMGLDEPFATNRPLNARDPLCPHCGHDGADFLERQAALVEESAP